MTSLQIREIPEELHRRLKARAALEGQSMSEYVLRELRRSLDIPTRQEMMERIAALDRIEVTESPADAVRAIRDAR
ncbi:MAG: toxin-antitoxin system HicB family antitoxin [Acidimicrobiales bacterium]|uniref:FitA-like ribbon-helix-helix domain-containing protein n=1 Tax=Candidatus Poriferisodalis multihospitum TaxID=2983191 RepID=UPI0013820AE0|nr:toxin-antitoxin system HicB family antitoxin [Candidatus Poriferisodalis multihospitum]MDE0135232.1 toxin-antitoxin system HicB family antitoxin [Acidimicrobiaceae bacterium]MXV87615.1 toxin-antitoxin system HicB family antitoxin [Acidimicrobiales bacterium]MDE0319840.1 toxin-antitoxin system HicB family antitoxin [Acidimicrobiaceae bacterium]MDE0499592.1 toxin-antitoxin system HicB family antitoxin [Acidimicrobiaceae bacterium]MXX43158.1 toxin-antitoxin system HicB family antitoxin [Acidim